MTIRNLNATRLQAGGLRMNRRGLLAWAGAALASGLPAPALAVGAPTPPRPRLAPLLEAQALPALLGRLHILDIREPDAADAAGARWPAGAVSAPATVAALGLEGASEVTVRGPRGEATYPLVVASMVDGVVWIPTQPRQGTGVASLGARTTSLVEVLR